MAHEINGSNRMLGTSSQIESTEQEKAMKNGFMPPAFQLAANPADPNNGTGSQSSNKTKIQDEVGTNGGGYPPEALAYIREREGYREKVYLDTKGLPTAGMGHLLTAEEKALYPVKSVVPKEVLDRWTQYDMNRNWAAATKQCAILGVTDQSFKIVLTSVNFQLGTAWNEEFPKTWKLMLAHKWEEAAIEAADSEWNSQTPTRVQDFQGALRKLAGVGAGSLNETGKTSEGKGLSAPFRRMLAEARAKARQADSKAGASAVSASVPVGKAGIMQIQERLRDLGLYAGKIDGIATSSKGESNTTKGIKAFQKAHNLSPTGVVDATTWSLMIKSSESKGSIWKRFMDKIRAEQKKAIAKPSTEVVGSKTKLNAPDGNGGWTIPAILPDEAYYSQIHPSKGGDKPIPRSVAFSGALTKYDHGGEADIYDESKCKSSWRKSSTEGREAKVYNLACKNTCDFIMRNAGFGVSGAEGSIYSLIKKKEGKKTVGNELASSYEEAKNRLDTYLENGWPVVVGVDYKLEGANESATDHFVIVVGRGEDEKGKYYIYMDVGRTMSSDGINYAKNRLYTDTGKDGDYQAGWVSGEKPNSTGTFFSLSEVREITELH